MPASAPASEPVLPAPVLTRLDLRETDLSPRELAAALPRAAVDVDTALDAIAPVMADVRERGAAALRDAAERFDRVRPEHLRVPTQAIASALDGLDSAVREALSCPSPTTAPGTPPSSPPSARRRSSPAGGSCNAGSPCAAWVSTCPAAWPSTRARWS